MPTHGEQRDHHYEDEVGQTAHIFSGSAIQSVCERYCAGCKMWIKSEGVVGNLRFMAEHGDHKESR